MIRFFESITNPKVRLSPWIPALIMWNKSNFTVKDVTEQEWEQKTLGEDDVFLGQYLILRLLRIPDYLRDPELRHEARSIYPRLVAVVEKLGRRLADISILQADPYGYSKSFFTSAKSATARLLAHYQRLYGIALLLSTLVNFVLRTFDPNNITLCAECRHFVKEIVAVSGQACQFRPLGSRHMTICLAVAWGIATDSVTQAEVVQAVEAYKTDYVVGHIMEYVKGLGQVFRDFRLKAASRVSIGRSVSEGTASSLLADCWGEMMLE